MFTDIFFLLLTRARGGRHNQKELLERPCAKVSCREKESIMLPQQSVDRYLMLGLPDSESIPRHLSAVEQNMRFAFGVMLKSTNEMEVLLASLRDDDGEGGEIECHGRVVVYQLLREDRIGVNTGGVEIRYPEGNEHGLLYISIYPHGLRGLLRSEAQGDITSLRKRCDTMRKSTLQRVRNAVIRIFRDLMHGTAEQKTASRQLFGLARIEFNMMACSYYRAHENLRKFLINQRCEDLMRPGSGDDANALRVQAAFRLLHSSNVAIRRVRLELVLESLIASVRDFHRIIKTLGTKPTVDERRRQQVPKKDYPQLLRIFKELGHRVPHLNGYAVDWYGDINQTYMKQLIETALLRRTFYTCETGHEIEGFCLADVRRNEWGVGDQVYFSEDEGAGARVREDEASSDDEVSESDPGDGESEDGVWLGVAKNVERSSKDPLLALMRGAFFARRNLMENKKPKYRTLDGYEFEKRFVSRSYAEEMGVAECEDMDLHREDMKERMSFGGADAFRVDIEMLLDMQIPDECGTGVTLVPGNDEEVKALSDILKAVGYSPHCFGALYRVGDPQMHRVQRAADNMYQILRGEPFKMARMNALTEKWWEQATVVEGLVEEVIARAVCLSSV